MIKRLQNKVAMITGAAGGIGYATSVRLREEGALVVACIQDQSQKEALKGLDILVNNAGIHLVASAAETTRDAWVNVMDINVWGTFLGCKNAIAQMGDRGGGAIVNLSSFAAIRGVPRQVAYATSKGAILTMTMALAADHAQDNIRINCVCPGATRTPIIEGLAASHPDPSSFLADLEAKTPLGNMAEPKEVAAAIAYLVSDDASHITGMALPVDGGRSSR